jgi:hypothetical protein
MGGTLGGIGGSTGIAGSATISGGARGGMAGRAGSRSGAGDATTAGKGGVGGNSAAGGAGGKAGTGASGGAVGGSAPPEPGRIFGFGVNGQPRSWGTDGSAVKPVLDQLVSDLGSNFFRVELYSGETDWEQKNDDDDPSNFNWSYYDNVFESKAFTDVWDYIRYLNGLGVNEIVLSGEGSLPTWMGGTKLSESQEDEFVETLLAVLVYARTRAPEPRPRFSMLTPLNEPAFFSMGEGFDIAPQPQGLRVMHKIVARMNSLPELDGIGLLAPDDASEAAGIGWRDAMATDDVIMARLRATDFHRYSGPETFANWDNANPPMWLSEFNSTWLSACYQTDWSMAFDLAGNLISALQSGVTAGLVWSDYDAPHSHQNDGWQTFGLFEGSLQGSSDLCAKFPGGSDVPSNQQLDAISYKPKPTYYAAKHAFRHIARGAQRIDADGAGLLVVAFKNPDGTIVVYGRNDGKNGEHSVTFAGSDALPASMVPYVSASGSYDKRLDPVSVSDRNVSVTLPSNAVFTLVSE